MKLYQFKYNINLIKRLQIIKYQKPLLVIHTKDELLLTPLYFKHKESLDVFIISIRPFFDLYSVSSLMDIWVHKAIKNDQIGINDSNHSFVNDFGFILINYEDVIEYGSNPLTYDQWINFYLDHSGKIKNKDSLISRIYYSGVDDNIRKDVWKFLLGYYSWDSTFKEREDRDSYLSFKYQKLLEEWKNISNEKEGFNDIIKKIGMFLYLYL